jgi:hypothetical protein
MTAPQPLPSRLIGALFVERGLVSESQIRIALEIQNETGQQLGQILVERFGVSRKELASVVAEQWAKLGGSAGPEDAASWRRLGDIFVDRGFVTQEELDQALARQRQTGERLGEALVAQGVISKFELAGALAEQMAALEATADETTAEAVAEATVHQLPTRPDESTDTAVAPVLELVPVERNGSEPTEPVDDASEEAELVAAEEASEPEPEEPHDDADVAVALDADEPAVEDVGLSKPPVEDGGLAEPSVEHKAEPEDTAGPEDTAEPEPVVDDVSFEEPAVACVAFAPTTRGYRLVALDAVPLAGETIDVPDVGLRLVLRVGRSPYPLDERTCVFLEEPVVWALALDAVH